jgi:U4/U6.U5 tri-snRNP component SNU23
MSNPSGKQVANVERRTWDVDAYEQKALVRLQQDQRTGAADSRGGRKDDSNDSMNPSNTSSTTKEEFQVAPVGAAGPEGSQRAFLQARKRKITDIDERIGSTTLISVTDAAGGSAASNDTIKLLSSDLVKPTGVGFHCTVCDCFLKDSLTYLDHINGRKHQRKLGFSMRVERSSESDLLSKLNELKQQHMMNDELKVDDEVNFDALVQGKDQEEERRKLDRQRKRKERRKLQKDINPAPEDTEEYNDVEEEQIDPSLAAMMGFSGFSGSKK